MAHTYVITVLTRDRVGIISSVTKTVFDLEGNIDAMSQTVLQGWFTIILTLTLPEPRTADDVREAIMGAGHRSEFAVSVQKGDQKQRKPSAVRHSDRFILTIVGDDKPGIIYRISSYLASRNINIEDLYAHVEHGKFILIGEAMIPKDQDVRQLQIDLGGLWPESAVSVRLQHVDIFAATNEIDFRHRSTHTP